MAFEWRVADANPMMLTLMVWRQMRALFIPLRFKSVQAAASVMVCLTGFKREAATYLKEVLSL